jgi:hypothetical protein
MFRTLSRLISTPFAAAAKRPSIRATPVRLPVRAKYDSAQTNADNRRHWAMADGLSAAAANRIHALIENPSIVAIKRPSAIHFNSSTPRRRHFG